MRFDHSGKNLEINGKRKYQRGKMNKIIISQITKELKITEKQVISVLNLLEEGNTVPFIARYRKEATGSLDEDQIRVVEKEYAYQAGLAKRKEEVISQTCSGIKYLMDNNIALDRIKLSQVGAENFIAGNKTPEDRAKNNRVEAYIYEGLE
mgnify:CR=1 FL=1